MNNTLKGILIISGLLVIMLIFGVILNYNELPAVIESESESEPVIFREEPKTESLWVLTKANIRSGPGKEFEVVTTLTMLEEIKVIKDDTSQWKEVVEPVKGYIFHTLVGDRKTAKSSYVKHIDDLVRELKNLGIVIKADGTVIYVKYRHWIGMSEKLSWEFVKQYAYAQQMKYNMESVICYVYDYHTGRKILYYNSEYDIFNRY